MKKRLLSALITIGFIGMLNFPISAYGTYGRYDAGINSTISFSAGGTGYSSGQSSPSSSDLKYDCYFSSVSFNGIQVNTIPGSNKVCFYPTPNNSAVAGTIASFGSVGGGYSYSYSSGYGGVGTSYHIASYSTYTVLGATVGVHWHA